MRWLKTKTAHGHKGQTRDVRKFLLMPRTLSRPDGLVETRWLEFAWVTQELEKLADEYGEYLSWRTLRWTEN